jgi:peptide/nickel transport system substrate-binding protein
MIASYRPNHALKLVRNPYFHEWSKAAQPDAYPDRVTVAIGGTADEAIRDVIRGQADVASNWWSGAPSGGHVADIKTRHASQVHINPSHALLALFLNTRLAPFDHLDARRAVSYAADRAAAVEAAGGPDLAQATCQVLPTNFPGHRPYCPFTAGSATLGIWTAPDLAKARALVARSGTVGMKVTVWAYAPLAGFGPYTVKLLRSLGYRASLKVLDAGYFAATQDSRTKAQIGWFGWSPDYPTPSNFFHTTLSCAAFKPASASNLNPAEYCDRRFDRQVSHALHDQPINPDAARAQWEHVDQEIVDEAPLVPLVNSKTVDILSKRVGNYQYNPGQGMLIDQLWVR